ncbi:MAG: DNA ligase D [Planctomycetaceae bacterium]
MALAEYKRKRRFDRTPEPAGKKSRRTAPGRTFVVQKHAARRLHYDFRLELDGVLKSWAVPKGPHLDPAVKSLAVHVEDHPLEYAAFEGVIPEGEYGGGTVMVWDRGEWEPEGDPQRDYVKGRLRFTLHGEKLRGGWTLVRMSGKASEDGDNWLLIKRKDAEARTGKKDDLLEKKSKSVLTGRDLDEIAGDADRVWTRDGEVAGDRKKAARRETGKRVDGARGAREVDWEDEIRALPGAKKARPPRTLQPELATLAPHAPEGDDWLHELKFDGYRLLAFVEDGRVRLLTRRGNDWTDRFPTVAAAVGELPINHAILDGEVVALRSDGTTDFQKLQNWMRQGKDERLAYFVFDLPHCGGYDLRQTPLERRKELLARLILAARADESGVLRYSDHIRGHGAGVLSHSCRAAMEGIVSKRADSPYRTRRTRDWLKVKCLNRQEFVVGGFTKPSGSRVGFGALLLGVYAKTDSSKSESKRLVYCGRVGTGFDNASLRALASELKKLTTRDCPFHDPPAEAKRGGVTWVEPRLVAEVEFGEWTGDGLLRHPSFQGLREDKPPEDIVREEPVREASRKTGAKKKTSAKTTGAKPQAARDSADAEVAGVRLSNPDRVFYPDQAITKLDLARYYESVAEWVLPHVADRPLTLVRCPRGRQAHCFYQKHLTEAMPDTLRGVEIKEKNEASMYVVVDDLPGLISLVQLGALELHPWGARADDVERPDRLVFDLDPGEGTDWTDVVRGARDVKERLDDLGLESFLRTTGGKGLHVVVPIVRRTNWDDAKEFARDIAEGLARDFPDRYLATMSKAKRKGKVFVDYLRNGRGATAIASYSTRARPGAPVATPLRWDELSDDRSPQGYTVHELPRRLKALKADPWEEFFDVKQSITKAMLAAVQ